MAIPVIEDHFQLQWIWHAPSGLPEDVFITTWYFRNDALGGAPWESMVDAVEAFWMSTPTGQAVPVTAWVPQSIALATAKVYDLGQALPRYPVYEETVVGAMGGVSGGELPREVAVVQSYYGGQGPRKRGRNYLGPLAQDVIDDTTYSHPTVKQQAQDVIAAAANDLKNTSLEITWVQVSTTYGVASPVQGGWVDDAFDTQRRRGKAPQNRLTWGDPPS